MHFGVHFPKENVQQRCAKMHFCITFSFGKCSAYIFQRKMFSKTKCYKCIFAYILQSQMFSCAKMHLMPKCCVFCFAKNKDAALTFCLQNVRKRQNAFDAKMHLMPKCILATQRNAVQKCIFASHFPKENVQHHIFQRKMFSITFDFVKCSASHFPKENIQQNKMLQMHLMPKCI